MWATVAQIAKKMIRVKTQSAAAYSLQIGQSAHVDPFNQQKSQWASDHVWSDERPFLFKISFIMQT